jgi:hypothetical protein
MILNIARKVQRNTAMEFATVRKEAAVKELDLSGRIILKCLLKELNVLV